MNICPLTSCGSTETSWRSSLGAWATSTSSSTGRTAASAARTAAASTSDSTSPSPQSFSQVFSFEFPTPNLLLRRSNFRLPSVRSGGCGESAARLPPASTLIGGCAARAPPMRAERREFGFAGRRGIRAFILYQTLFNVLKLRDYDV